MWLCKGFEYGSGLLPHQVVREVLGDTDQRCCGLVRPVIRAGSRAQPAMRADRGVRSSAELRERVVVAAVHGGSMRVYACDDLVGVEVGGAVKNILAIATGVADGLGLGLNARAALITRGLAEITRLGTILGGRTSTFMGLTGMGDLILTCTGDLSRNRRVGLALAQGKPLDDDRRRTGPRGRRRAVRKRAVRELATKPGRGHADHECGGRRAVRWG